MSKHVDGDDGYHRAGRWRRKNNKKEMQQLWLHVRMYIIGLFNMHRSVSIHKRFAEIGGTHIH